MTTGSRLATLHDLFRFPDSAICIPLAPRVPNPPRVAAILGMRLMQRLHSVRQLALARLVYPDATHARFGHSLGVFYRCGKFVQAMTARRENGLFREEVGPREIAALLAAALIHDAGHYPMAHAFEELIPDGTAAELVKHEEVLVRMLQGQLPGVFAPDEQEALATALHEWEGITIKDVLAILTGHPHYAETVTSSPEVLRVLHSLLDGPFDADKLDYVQRDAIHTGNPSGGGVDEDRLIDSVVVRSFTQGIGISESGLYAAQSLHLARATMFKEVYWHRTNRAANRMFAEALSLLTKYRASVINGAFEQELFHLNDEAVLGFAHRHLSESDAGAAAALIEPLQDTSGKRNHLFQRVVTVSAPKGRFESRLGSALPDDLHGKICALYDGYLEPAPTRRVQPWRDFEQTARTRIAALGKASHHYEVLLDVPDARFETPVHGDPNREIGRSGYWVFVGEEAIPVGEKDPLFGAVLENWRINARKVRVLASPAVAGRLEGKQKQLVGILNDLAGQSS